MPDRRTLWWLFRNGVTRVTHGMSIVASKCVGSPLPLRMAALLMGEELEGTTARTRSSPRDLGAHSLPHPVSSAGCSQRTVHPLREQWETPMTPCCMHRSRPWKDASAIWERSQDV